jgi:hypothetical protein
MSDKEIGAILTPSMRKFYRETPDGKGSTARNIRQRSRKRFVAALADVDLLSETLRDKDRRWIVDHIPPEQLDTHLERFIALFARELDTTRLEGIIERGVKRARVDEGYPSAIVDVSIEIEAGARRDELVEQWERLSDEEKLEIINANPALLLDKDFDVSPSLLMNDDE